MKKRIVAVLMSCCVVFAMSGCSKKCSNGCGEAANSKCYADMCDDCCHYWARMNVWQTIRL